jgi:hypothetical protein
MISGLFIYFINRPAGHFPFLLFQTRYGTNCFARQGREEGAVTIFVASHTPVVFLPTNHKPSAYRAIPPRFAVIDRRQVLLTKSRSPAANSRKLPFNGIGRIEPPEVRIATIDDWHRGTAEDSLRGT